MASLNDMGLFDDIPDGRGLEQHQSDDDLPSEEDEDDDDIDDDEELDTTDITHVKNLF